MLIKEFLKPTKEKSFLTFGIFILAVVVFLPYYGSEHTPPSYIINLSYFILLPQILVGLIVNGISYPLGNVIALILDIYLYTAYFYIVSAIIIEIYQKLRSYFKK